MINKQKIMDLSGLAGAVVVIQLLLSNYIYPLLGKTTQQIFAIGDWTAQTAITSPTIGNKVVSAISGLIPIDFTVPALATLAIEAFVLLLIGYWVYDQKWAYKGKNISQRLFAILGYGTAVLFAFLLITGMSATSPISIGVGVGLIMNYAIISVIVVQLAKRVRFLRI